MRVLVHQWPRLRQLQGMVRLLWRGLLQSTWLSVHFILRDNLSELLPDEGLVSAGLRELDLAHRLPHLKVRDGRSVRSLQQRVRRPRMLRAPCPYLPLPLV